MHSPLAVVLPQEYAAEAVSLSCFLRQQIDLFGFGRTLGDLSNLLANHCNERDQDRLKQLVQLGYRFDGLRNRQIHDFIEYVEPPKSIHAGHESC